jgi:ribosomal protein S18 acetylase RimI-like enzyme
MIRHRPLAALDMSRICSFPQNEEELFYFFPTARYPLTTEQLSLVIAERTAPTVVENGGQVVAFADLFHLKHSDYYNIGNVIVAPEARGQGMGRYLIAQMVNIARKMPGAKWVRGSCFNSNTAGLLLYTGLGFAPYGLEERFDWQGNRVALVHFRKFFP